MKDVVSALKKAWSFVRENERFQSVFLNSVISVLLFLVFLQCGIYLNGSIKTDTEEAIPFDMRVLSASAQDAVYSLDPTLLYPAEIAIASPNGAYAAVNSAAVIGDLYVEIAPVLAAAMLNEPTEGTDALWSQTVSDADVIRIRYRAALPYQIIHAFAAAEVGEDARVRRSEMLSVRELCLTVSDGTACVTVRGESGVYTFFADTELEMSEFQLYASMYPDVFYPCVLSETCVITEKVSSRDIAVQGGICAEIMGNETHFDQWIRRFRFNPDKLNYHVEADGTAVYVESHGVLTCTPDQITYTAAEDGGVRVSEFCSVSGEVDVYTYLRAASGWISEIAAMDRRYTGGDASLCLVSVVSDGASLTLHFSLCAENLPIYVNGNDTAFSVTFTGENLTGMVYRPVAVRRQLTRSAAFLESWSMRLFGTEHVELVFLADTNEPLSFAQWIAYGEVAQ